MPLETRFSRKGYSTMIDVVLFDIGGTLHTVTNSEELRTAFAKRLRERLADYGIYLRGEDHEIGRRLHENAEEYKHFSEQILGELPQSRIWNEFYLKDYHIGEELLAPIAEELSFLYDYERVQNMRRPHIVETMEALRQMGMRLGIISNIISTSFVPHILREYGIAQYMECVVLSSEAGVRKPNPAIFEIAFQQLGVKAENVAYVGDTLSRDVLGAKNANLGLMILIDNPAIAHRDKGLQGKGIEPDVRIHDLFEIPAILASYSCGKESKQ